MNATLTNDFHCSKVTVRVPASGVLSERQTKRVYRELCGMADCTCGGVRGPQELLPDGFCCDKYAHLDRIAIIEKQPCA